MKIDFYPEICCEECNGVIHNHFDCPACNQRYAGTSCYGDIGTSIGTEISCEECRAKFKMIKEGSWISDPEWEQVHDN